MEYPKTIEEFRGLVGELQASGTYRAPIAFGVGRRLLTRNRIIASVRYPVVNGPGQNTGTAAILMNVLGITPEGVQSVHLDADKIREALLYFAPFENDGQPHANIRVLERAHWSIVQAEEKKEDVVATFIFDDVAPEGVDDSTLKLYALSNRLVKPNELNVDRIFTKLPNVIWVGDDPMDAEEVDDALMKAAFDGAKFAPNAADKFPFYLHRVNALKMGVRIPDHHDVRLGAYLGEGTTVMPGSFINFNAGTDGASMVEGLIASSVRVGDGSDIGNGARMLGVLSGGNSRPISIGRNCLLELNSSLGIPIGDAVVIAAGTSVMASSHVNVRLEGHPMNGSSVKAGELAGVSAATFRRNDKDGQLEVVRTARNIEFACKLADGETILNADLHQNA